MKDIPGFCVLVGANGSGKSTLFQVFGFLKDAMTSNVTTALAKLGGSLGFEEVRSRNSKGNIEIELKFREKSTGPIITYYLSIGFEDSKPIVESEILKYRRGMRGQPWQFLKFSRGEGEAVSNEPEKTKDQSELKREPQALKSPDILAIKGLAQFQKFPAVVALGNLIENWHVSNLMIDRARHEPEAGYAEHLSTTGDNLALVTEFLYKNHPDIFGKILRELPKRIPGLVKVEAKTTEYGRVLLKFRDGEFENPFLARYVSDGTIKMFQYMVLLYDPKPHQLLCVEEPENHLYPDLLLELAEEFRTYADKGGQVFVSTHSPDFLNAVELDEVYWLVKEKGYTKIRRAKDDPQIKAYMDDGDQMGHLWKQGLFKDVGPK
jgi:predicted ATPase